MTPKQIALQSLKEAFQQLHEYRGIAHFDDEFFDYNTRRHTAFDVRNKTTRVLDEIGKPIEPITERQIEFLSKLIDKNRSTKYIERVELSKLNKYQARQAIDYYLTEQRFIFSPDMNTNEYTFAWLEERENKIIERHANR